MTKNNRLVLNGVTNYFRYAILILTSFLLTPVILERVGADDFGLWSLMISFLSILGLLDLGFGTSLVKYVAESRGAGDPGRRNRIASTLGAVYLLIAFLALLFLVAAAFLLPDFAGLPQDKRGSAIALLWLLGLRTAFFGLPFGLFRGVLFGEQMIGLVNLIQTVATLLYGLLGWLSLEMELGIVFLAFVGLVAIGVEHIAYFVFAFKRVDGFRVHWRLAEFSLLKEMKSFVIYSFVVNVAALVLLRTDLLIVTAFFPLSAVAAYAIVLKISEHCFLLLKQFINVLAPHVAELKGHKEEGRISSLFINCTKYIFAAGSMIAVGLHVYGPDLLWFWVGPEYSSAAPVLSVLMTAMTVTSLQVVASTMLTMSGHPRIPGRAAVLSVLVNLAVSFALVKPLGLLGIALGTLTAAVSVDVGIVVREAVRIYGGGIKSYFAKAIMPALLPGFVQLVFSLALKSWLIPGSLFGAVGGTFLGFLCFAVVFGKWGLNESEKSWFREKTIEAVGSVREAMPQIILWRGNQKKVLKNV